MYPTKKPSMLLQTVTSAEPICIPVCIKQILILPNFTTWCWIWVKFQWIRHSIKFTYSFKNNMINPFRFIWLSVQPGATSTQRPCFIPASHVNVVPNHLAFWQWISHETCHYAFKIQELGAIPNWQWICWTNTTNQPSNQMARQSFFLTQLHKNYTGKKNTKKKGGGRQNCWEPLYFMVPGTRIELVQPLWTEGF